MTTLDVTAPVPERPILMRFFDNPFAIFLPVAVVGLVGGILSNNAAHARRDARALVEAGAAFETVERASVRDGLTLDASPAALSTATADLPAPP